MKCEVFQPVMDVLQVQLGHDEIAEVEAICSRRDERLNVVEWDSFTGKTTSCLARAAIGSHQIGPGIFHSTVG